MGSVNKVILLGNLGSDPEQKFLASGQAVCNFRIATTEKRRDKNEQLQERTEWHRIVVYGKQAENAAKYLGKGKQVYIEGKIQTRSWEKDGATHYISEIVATSMVFVGSAGSGGQSKPAPASSAKPTASKPSPAPADVPDFDSGLPMGDDDIPF